MVTASSVEVVAPRRAWQPTIDAFVHANRFWIEKKVQILRQKIDSGELRLPPSRLVTGARILFRGRRLRLTVELADVDDVEIRYATAFHLRVPRGLSVEAQERAARTCLDRWFTDRARADAGEMVSRFAPLLGVQPNGIRIGNQKTLWGSCSARGVVSLNRKLVGAPRKVFEYVVVHELAHLRERNHGAAFWALVESLVPDYRDRRAWLRRHGVALA